MIKRLIEFIVEYKEVFIGILIGFIVNRFIINPIESKRIRKELKEAKEINNDK